MVETLKVTLLWTMFVMACFFGRFSHHRPGGGSWGLSYGVETHGWFPLVGCNLPLFRIGGLYLARIGRAKNILWSKFQR